MKRKRISYIIETKEITANEILIKSLKCAFTTTILKPKFNKVNWKLTGKCQPCIQGNPAASFHSIFTTSTTCHHLPSLTAINDQKTEEISHSTALTMEIRAYRVAPRNWRSSVAWRGGERWSSTDPRSHCWRSTNWSIGCRGNPVWTRGRLQHRNVSGNFIKCWPGIRVAYKVQRDLSRIKAI